MNLALFGYITAWAVAASIILLYLLWSLFVLDGSELHEVQTPA